jgi:hypothetical protein
VLVVVQLLPSTKFAHLAQYAVMWLGGTEPLLKRAAAQVLGLLVDVAGAQAAPVLQVGAPLADVGVVSITCLWFSIAATGRPDRVAGSYHGAKARGKRFADTPFSSMGCPSDSSSCSSAVLEPVRVRTRFVTEHSLTHTCPTNTSPCEWDTRPQEALPPLRAMLERAPGVELADAAEESPDAPNAGAGWPPIYYGLILLEKAVVALPQVHVP